MESQVPRVRWVQVELPVPQVRKASQVLKATQVLRDHKEPPERQVRQEPLVLMA